MHFNLSNSSQELKNVSQKWIAPDILIECSTSQAFGVYVVVLFIVGLMVNTELLWILFKHKRVSKTISYRNLLLIISSIIFKELLTNNAINILIFILTILGEIGTIFELPLVFIAAFKC